MAVYKREEDSFLWSTSQHPLVSGRERERASETSVPELTAPSLAILSKMRRSSCQSGQTCGQKAAHPQFSKKRPINSSDAALSLPRSPLLVPCPSRVSSTVPPPSPPLPPPPFPTQTAGDTFWTGIESCSSIRVEHVTSLPQYPGHDGIRSVLRV